VDDAMTTLYRAKNIEARTQRAVAYIDIETASKVKEAEIGRRNYLIHPTTDVCCCAYAIGDGPIQPRRPGEPLPDDLVAPSPQPRGFNEQPVSQVYCDGVDG
jgi:hypothetical protein